MKDIEAPIKEVTVYADRALITRRGSIHLEAGEHELRINNLPQFTKESLRAAGQGPEGTRILNVDIATAFYSHPPEAEVQALQTELEGLQQQKQLLKARQEALNDRRQWLRAIGEQSHDFAKGLAQGQMKPEDCGDFFRFMTTQSLEDAEAAQEQEQQQRSLQKEIDAKKRQLQQKQGNAHPDRLAATVAVEIVEEGEFELELSYLVTNASWQPQYDVRVQLNEQASTGSVELTYMGMVKQTTGENWEQVELALSTARPSQAATLPELQPWYLNVFTPPMSPMSYGMMASPMLAPAAPSGASRKLKASFDTGEPGVGRAEKEDMMMDTILPPQPVTAEVATASVEHTGTALVFRIGRSVDIPSDNSAHKTTIARDELPCEFDYVSAPAIEAYAHLRASITNTTERVLLKGTASIFLSGEYVGSTAIKSTATNEQFKIFLGIDDDIKIKREPTERTVEKGNILQNDIRRSTYAYRITVHNYASNPRKIVVRDHLPVPQHERIKVKIQSMQPQPTEHTRLELMTWEFKLGADGEQKIEYRFMVEHPQNLKITGLPTVEEINA